MDFVGIAHTAFSVADMDASLDFYINKLGFTHAFSFKDGDGKPVIEYLNVAPGQFVELFYAEKPYTGRSPYDHMCLRVKDINTALRQVEAAGISIDVALNQACDMNWQFWIHDPDGNRIEFMQITPESPHAKYD